MKTILILLCFCASIVIAQPQHAKTKTKGKGKGNQEQESNNKGKDHKQKGKPEHVSKEHKPHTGNGHAYGKNKEDLNGREFGHERAGKASTKVNHACAKGDKTIDKLYIRIEKAKTKIELETKNGKISVVIALAKMEQIKLAEQKLASLKLKIELERKLVIK